MVWGVIFEDSDLEAIRKYVRELGVTYPILGYGQDPKTGYGQVRVLPTTFIINKEGKFHRKFEEPVTAMDRFVTTVNAWLMAWKTSCCKSGYVLRGIWMQLRSEFRSKISGQGRHVDRPPK